MMFRLIRFLIIALTLGRIKWLMRLTWVWRFVVFLGATRWIAKRLRQAIGLDSSRAKTEVDSAWAEALRYAPTPATATSGGATTGPVSTASPPAPVAPAPSEPASESLSEVTGFAEDGSSETITIHEVRAKGESETIVRIADDIGNVETVVTSSSVEDIDLVHLGTQAEEPEPSIEEIVAAEIEEEAAIDEILATMEAAEPDLIEIEEIAMEADESVPVEAVEIAPVKPKTRRKSVVAEPEPEPVSSIDPDWVRGDGSLDCPDAHPVKAKVSSMIYYVPESGHYGRTIPDVCFASDADAEAAGYRAPRH